MALPRRTFLMVASFIVAAPVLAQGAAVPDPIATVKRVYSPKVKEADRPYSAALRKAYDIARKKGEDMGEELSGLDFDPVINGQDDGGGAYLKTLRFTLLSQEADKAQVGVTFRMDPEVPEETLHYALILADGEWHIDDIVNPRSGNNGWRLSALLALAAQGQ